MLNNPGQTIKPVVVNNSSAGLTTYPTVTPSTAGSNVAARDSDEKVLNAISFPTWPHDLVCLSDLPWSFVFQRPQHLMSRFARERRVFFIEGAVRRPGLCRIEMTACPYTGVHIVTPYLTPESGNDVLELMIAEFLHLHAIHRPILWFCTPIALAFFPSSARAAAVVYDCMDESSRFRDGRKDLQVLEDRLLSIVDLVFTGGVSLCEAKRRLHPNVHPFPSGVDFSHFARARTLPRNYAGQKTLAQPTVGYAGIIDERLDLSLLDEVAALRREWQFIMIGPTVKISPERLPRRANIHWLGMKDYDVLPNHFAGWDVGMMPFALNDATRFISPTTPEYLAAGLPVVSTAIRDVIRPYGELGLTRIVHSAGEFVAAAECAMATGMGFKWRERADEFLRSLSWDSVWSDMNRHITQVLGSEESTIEVRPAQRQARAAHV